MKWAEFPKLVYAATSSGRFLVFRFMAALLSDGFFPLYRKRACTPGKTALRLREFLGGKSPLFRQNVSSKNAFSVEFTPVLSNASDGLPWAAKYSVPA